MKRAGSLIIIGLILSVFAISVVSAASVSQQVGNAIGSLVDIVKPILTAFFGNINATGGMSSDDLFFGKLLIAVIVLAVVYSIMETIEFFKGKPWVLWTVSLAVTILGVRFISPEMISTVVLSNQALAVALTSIIPFVIYFVFVESGLKEYGKTFRRTLWIFFAAVFLGLYFIRSDSLGDLAWVYPITAIAAIIMAFMDGTIQRYFRKAKFEKTASIAQQRHYLQLLAHRETLENELGTAITSGAGKKAIDSARDRLESIDEEIKRIGAA